MIKTDGWTPQDAKRDLGPLMSGNDASQCSDVLTPSYCHVELGLTAGNVIQLYVVDSRGFEILRTTNMHSGLNLDDRFTGD